MIKDLISSKERVESNLDKFHQTIGNYFLIKDFSYVYNKLLN